MEKNQDPPQWSTAKGHRVEYESCSANLSSIKGLPVTQATGVLEAPAYKSSSENLILRRRTPHEFEDNPNNAVSNSERSQLPKEDEEKAHQNVETVKVGTQCMPFDLGNIEDVDNDREIALGQHPDLQDFPTGSAQKCARKDPEEVDNVVQVPAKEDKRMGHQKNNSRRKKVIVVIAALILVVLITRHYFSSASDVGRSAKVFHIGDILVVPRFGGLYEHYMIITSNTSVVHLTGGTNDWTKFNKATVKEEELDVSNFIKDKNVTIESGAWEGKEPLPADEIVKRARSQIGEGGYHLLFYNCEHFARWCRYGESESYQAKKLSHLLNMFGGINVFWF